MTEEKSVYQNIDLEKTGRRIHELAVASGYEVKDIQKFLHLSCPQPIYRWFKGKVLPSVDHMYMLSILFGVHMEELIVAKGKSSIVCFINLQNKKKLKQYKRVCAYWRRLRI